MESTNSTGLFPQYKSIAEVKKLGFPEHFLRERLKANTIPHIMVGKKYFINVPLFMKLMERESLNNLNADIREKLDVPAEDIPLADVCTAGGNDGRI